MSPLSHNAKFPSLNISWKPIYYHNQKYSLLSRHGHLANKIMNLRSASGSPKAFGFGLSKNSEGRSNASLVLVIILRNPVHSICKGQLVCLLVEEIQLRGSTPTHWKSFLHQRGGPHSQALSYSNEYHCFFLQISSLFYHCIQENNYLGKIFHLQSHYRKE